MQTRFTATVRLTLMLFLLLALAVGWRAEASQQVVADEDDALFCVWEHCATTYHLKIGGLVAGATGVAAGATAYIYGPEAAIAAAGGLLLFGHFFFDVVPLGVAGAMAYVYGPEAWGWLGMESDDVESKAAD